MTGFLAYGNAENNRLLIEKLLLVDGITLIDVIRICSRSFFSDLNGEENLKIFAELLKTDGVMQNDVVQIMSSSPLLAGGRSDVECSTLFLQGKNVREGRWKTNVQCPYQTTKVNLTF